MTILSDARRLVAGTTSRRWLRYLPASALIIDACLLIVTGLVSIVGRRELNLFTSSASIEDSLTVAGPLILAGWVTAIAALRGYSPDVFGAGTDEFKRVINASLVAAAMTGVGCYLAKFDLSRGFYVLTFVTGLPALVIGRVLLRRALHTARRHGALRQRVVVSGSRSHIDEIANILRRETWLGYDVVGALTPEYDLSEETSTGIPVLGNAGDAAAVARSSGIDVIFFAGGAVASSTQFRQIVWELEAEDIKVVMAPSITDISSERLTVRPVGGLPLMHIEPPTWYAASRWAKRTFDLLASGLLIIAFSPLLLLTAWQIKSFDRGPVFFRQARIGKGGNSFVCFKFRTMVVDAESLVADLQAETGQAALLFKMKDDPRITRPGKWLRRLSIDELPQLFNVFTGDMSLVGPRPQVAAEVALYDSSMSRRLHVRPGMTGLWQVSGRNDLSPDEAMRLDLYYVDNWSMTQDLAILGRTFGAVLFSRGAY